MNKNILNNKGFTLIELLVVISIIGILTALVTANLSSAQARARDGRRKTDLKAIATGLEFYYTENYVYPASTEMTMNGGQLTAPSPGTNVYIKKIPTDPRNPTGADAYHYCSGTTAPRKTFNLYATLENTKDPDRYCGDTTATGWDTPTTVSCDAVKTGCDSAMTTSNFTITQPD
jgi:general secretion pathway protein G